MNRVKKLLSVFLIITIIVTYGIFIDISEIDGYVQFGQKVHAYTTGTDSNGRTTYTFNFTGAEQTWVAPNNVRVKIECWGAQGGRRGSVYGGSGGYSSGEININRDQTLFVYVGGGGKFRDYTGDPYGASTGGWNGGGWSYPSVVAGRSYDAGASGGGATDVRKGGNTLNNRCIVAGGGGGAAYFSNMQSYDAGWWSGRGTGGGLTGGTDYTSTGGTQTSGGTCTNTKNNGGSGGFGYGGAGSTAAGGGGGWYGGAGGGASAYTVYGDGSTQTSAGGGGSGYIGGVENGTTTAGQNGVGGTSGGPADGYARITVLRNLPVVSITTPISGSSTAGLIRLQGTVSNVEFGDIVTIKYNIDGGTSCSVPGTVTATGNFTPTDIDVTGLNEGNHILNVWCQESKGWASNAVSIPFKLDKTAPALGTVLSSSTLDSITLSGSATDNIAGLDPNPYKYTIGTTSTNWLAATSYTWNSLNSPNTEYSILFEARDLVGNVASSLRKIYTKAAVPILSTSNASSYTLDVVTSDNNSSHTQYQISVNNGTHYITQEGTLTASPTWITLTNRKVSVSGLTPSTRYSFQAKARNAENIETSISEPITCETLVAPPGSPANIIATATDKTITVSWDGVNEAIGYDIEVDGTVINTGTGTTYTHLGLSPGNPHAYRVRAKNAGGPGNWSATVSKSTLPGSPDIPANLNAIPLSTSITVTWNNVPGATGYDIEVDGTLVNNGPNTNYIHNSLTPGTHHSYRVRSINPGGKSEWSGYVNATTLLDTSPVPTNLTAVPAKSSITLTWDAVNGASGYDIEVDGVAINNGTRTTYTHSNLAPDTQHIYRVRSKKGGATSEWSSAMVSATIADVFGIPANFKANAGDTSVFLSWDPVSQAVGYDVEVDGVAADNGTDTTSMHNGLVANSSHTYRVRARSATETSEWSAPLSVTTFGLPTPTNVTAVSDETTITSVWQAVYGATSYDLEFDGSIVPGIPDTTYTSSGLNPNSQHVIRVRAVNESGTSNWSLPLTKSTLLGGGNVPSVSGMSRTTSVTLMWNAMNGTTGYDIEADGTVISDVAGTTYNFNGLTAGTQHAYRVRAKNSSGIGNWSSTFTVSTLPHGPAVPTNVAASSNMTSILVTWDQVVGATEYELEADGTIISNGSGTSYLHTGLTPDTNHTYKVRSKNTAGYSNWSTTAAMRTVSSVQTFDLNSTIGEEFGLVLSASNIQDLGGYTFTVKYDTDDFEVIDLCGLTSKLDTQAGDISGTDITVTQVIPGTIVFTKIGSTQSWQVWSGIVNSIKFKSKRSGQSTITYTIQ